MKFRLAHERRLLIEHWLPHPWDAWDWQEYNRQWHLVAWLLFMAAIAFPYPVRGKRPDDLSGKKRNKWTFLGRGTFF